MQESVQRANLVPTHARVVARLQGKLFEQAARALEGSGPGRCGNGEIGTLVRSEGLHDVDAGGAGCW